MKKVLSALIIGILCVSTLFMLTPRAKANAGLVGYWKFDEGSGATAYDSSGNENTGTLTSSPQWVNGIVGTSLEFDGIDDVVMVPSSASLVVARAQNQLTLETWIRPTVTLDSSATPMYLITKGNEYGFELNNEGDAYNSPILNGKIRFCTCLVNQTTGYLQPEEIWTDTNVWTAGTWYHLAATYDENSLKIYVNGVLENSRQLTGNLWPTVYGGELYPLSIAAYTIGPHYTGGNLFFFKGILDEVKVYDYARTAEEIQSDYVSVSRELVGHWKFDEGSGAIASDNSRNGNTGSVVGAQWIDGISGKALSFDGLDDYVDVPSSTSLTISGNEVSFELWLKPTITIDSNSPSINFAEKGDEYGFQMMSGDGRIWFVTVLEPGPQTNWQGIQTTTDRWNANTWYHLAGTYDGSSLKVYVNGLCQNSRPLSGNLNLASYQFVVGCHTFESMNFVNGVIDEVKIYNYARTAEEIQNDYNSLFPPVGQKPVAILHLDDTVHNIGADVWFYGDQSYDPDGGKITSYTFDFDDGTPYQTVYWPTIGTTHQYSASGEYFPRMKVTNDKGTESDWVFQKLTILPRPGFPTAILTVYPNPQKVGGIVTFDASLSNDPDGISEYGFDFGDGTPIQWTSNPIATHSYSQTGDYYARVCVSDNTGLETWSIKQRITIRNEEPPQPTTLKVTIQSNPPIRVGAIPFAVTFTATPSGGKGTYSVSWQIKNNIGGTWSSTQNPLTFNFKYSDTYVVKATAMCSGTSEVATAETTVLATGTVYEAKFTLWSGIVQAGTNNPLVSLEYNNIQNSGYFTVSGASVSLKTGVRVSFNGGSWLPDWLFDLIGISAPWYSIKISDSAGTVDAVPLVQLKAGTATPIDVTLPSGTPTKIEWGYMYNFSASPTSSRAISADLVSCIFAALGLKVEEVAEPIKKIIFMAIVEHLDETMGSKLVGLPFMSPSDQLALIQTVINDVLTPDYLISVAAAVAGDLGRSLLTKALQTKLAAATVLSDLALFFGAIYRGDLWDQYYVSEATPILYACIDPPETLNAVLNTPYGLVGYKDGVWVNEGNFSGFYHSEILNNTYGFGIPIATAEYCGDLAISSPSGNSIPYNVVINWMNNTSTSQGEIGGTPKTIGIEVFETGQMTSATWEYIFKDTKHGTTLKISTDDKYFQFIAPSKDFGIKHDLKMIVYRNTVTICYSDKEMCIAAIATTGKTKTCAATVLDKQTRRLYLLIYSSCR